ncbi:MAG: DUF11 domain-containing protein [Rhizobiaceae bacterium]
MATIQPVQAGDFTFDWGGTHNWPTNGVGPYTFTMTDQYGFRLDARTSVTRFGGSAYSGTPDDLYTFAGNTFGSEYSIWLVWDSANGNSGVGESTNTATLEFLTGATPVAVDALSFRVSDIDPVDNNSGTDRCDFVTLTGNAGNPTLSYVSPLASSRSVRIGPGSGSGATGALAANQAQCIYNFGSTGSNVSDGDDFGSILATYPAGTSVATIAYDESIENVYGVTSRNAAVRGVGVWGASAITVNQSISLVKTTAATGYSTLGETITYTYTITNDGPLPINTGQNIQIQDDLIGTFTCGTIAADIPVGGTHSCNANYVVTAGDMVASDITNNAVAGVGTGAQSFATRLQSNTSQVVLPRELLANLVTVKTLSSGDPTPAEGDAVTFLVTVTNNGADQATNVTLTDLLPAGLTATVNNGTVSQGSYASGTGVWTVGTLANGASATLTLEGTVDVGEGGNVITNTTTAATTPDQTDPTTTGDDLTESVTVDNDANLVTAKTLPSGDPTPTEGDTVTFLVTVTNNGAAQATNVSLTDLLPAGLTATVNNGTVSQGSYASGTGVWTVGTLANGASATLTLEGTVDVGEGGNVITNTTTAATTPDQTDPTTAGDDLTESVTVNDFQLSVTKVVDVADVSAAGAALNYTMTVTNTGNAELTGIGVADTLAQGVGSTALTLSGPTGDGGVAGVLEVGEVWTYTASHVVSQAEIDDDNDLVNTLDVTTSETGATLWSASATTTNSATRSLSVSKAPDVASVSAVGDVITYTITLTNTGTKTLRNIAVSDPLLSGMSCTPGTGATPDDLAPGGVATCTGTYAAAIADFDTNGGGDGDIDNTVTVTANGGVNETASAAVILNINPGLTITKTADDTTDVVAGQVITYTYRVENTGNQTITNVSLSDAHGGSGAAPVPSNETLTADNGPLGDSTDGGIDGTWDAIAPGDVVTFTATYTVTQSDVDTLQ